MARHRRADGYEVAGHGRVSNAPRPNLSVAPNRRATGCRRAALLAVLVSAVILVACYALARWDPLSRLRRPAPTLVPRAARSASWWYVYFTDPQTTNDPSDLAGSIPEKLIRYINESQSSIDVAAFEFDLDPVAEALVEAHQRGVEVRWVTDDEYGIEADEDEGHGQFKSLELAGIAVKDDERSALMHNKFWIFDRRTVWTGSTNVTVNDTFRNNNNVLVMDAPAVAAMYEREFAEMWAGKFGPTSPSTVRRQSTVINGTRVQVLFAAEDDVMNHLVRTIGGARTGIRFMAFSFTDDGMGAALLSRARAGVDVKGIFEKRGSETEYSELSRFYCASVPVRQDGNPRTFHHKVLVIDNEIVVTGSLNFSANANQSNDENVVILANQDVAARYLQEFDRRWAEATEPDAADMRCG